MWRVAEEDRGAFFTGVCSLNGCRRALRDGLIAYREKCISDSDRVAENTG